MPVLRPFAKLAPESPLDASFFLDTLVPAVRAAGYAGVLALVVTDAPHLGYGEAATADVVVVGTAAELSALLAGKHKTELSPLDKLKAHKHGAGAPLAVQGRPAALRALVAALLPKREQTRASARDISAESDVVKAPKRDRVRTASGRYIKGARASGPREGARALPPTTSSAARGCAAVDRTSFAMHNLAAFVSAGLARAGSVHDDVLVNSPGADGGHRG